MPLTIGSRLGSYEIVGAIGAGGMGEIYRALDTKLDRDVAIKVLRRRVSPTARRRSSDSSAKRKRSPRSRTRTFCRSSTTATTPASSTP